MKTSSFGGHEIYQTDSALTNVDSNVIFESYDINKKNEIQTKLKNLGIYEFEQVYSIDNTKSSEFLRSYLAINKSEYENLIEYSKNVIGEDGLLNLKQSVVFNKGLGAVKPDSNLLLESIDIERVKQVTDGVSNDFLYAVVRAQSLVLSNLQSVSDYTNCICPFHNFLPIKNQGNRGTCVAFSITASNEYYQMKNGRNDLSEQHLYYEAKQIDGDNNCGTTIANAIKVISTQGQSREQFWAYRPTTECNDHGNKPILADLDSQFFKAACLELDSHDIEIFKAAIISGGFISFSIPVYNSWVNSNEVNRTGRITLPLPDERVIGGHAMTIVGFQNDDNFPGGGFFLFRNSWGLSWAKESPYGQGFGIIPFEYITQHCWEAFTLINT